MLRFLVSDCPELFWCSLLYFDEFVDIIWDYCVNLLVVIKFVTETEPAIIGLGKLELVFGIILGAFIGSSYQVTFPCFGLSSIVSVYCRGSFSKESS